jgi:hypothetical protein
VRFASFYASDAAAAANDLTSLSLDAEERSRFFTTVLSSMLRNKDIATLLGDQHAEDLRFAREDYQDLIFSVVLVGTFFLHCTETYQIPSEFFGVGSAVYRELQLTSGHHAPEIVSMLEDFVGRLVILDPVHFGADGVEEHLLKTLQGNLEVGSMAYELTNSSIVDMWAPLAVGRPAPMDLPTGAEFLFERIQESALKFNGAVEIITARDDFDVADFDFTAAIESGLRKEFKNATTKARQKGAVLQRAEEAMLSSQLDPTDVAGVEEASRVFLVAQRRSVYATELLADLTHQLAVLEARLADRSMCAEILASFTAARH